MKRFDILNRHGEVLGQVSAESRRKALAEAKARNANGDRSMRGAYRARFNDYDR